MLEIFCPQCNTLILDKSLCPTCGWVRPSQAGAVGAVIWSADLGTKLNKPHCYPVIAGEIYCLGTEDGVLLGLDVQTGEVRWEHNLGERVMAHALATDGRYLFAGPEDTSAIPVSGKGLLALDAETGQPIWPAPAPTQAHSLSAPAVAGGKVYFTATDGWLRAVNAENGNLLWRAEHPTWGPAPPVLSEGLVYVGGRGELLAAYRADSGAQVWRFEGEGWFAHPLYVYERRLYALSWRGHLYVLDLQDGKLLWESEGERARGYTTPPALGLGHLFIGSRVYCETESGKEPGYALLALDPATGKEHWRYYTEKHILTPPGVVQDLVCFGANDGTFYAISAHTGEALWSVQIKSRVVTGPQIAGDYVLFGGRDGMIHAIRWRAEARAAFDAPMAYLQRGQYLEAATAYALQGDLAASAKLYAQQLQDWRKAVRLYEAAERPDLAAEILMQAEQFSAAAKRYTELEQLALAAAAWERAGELRQARDCYQAAGERAELARILGELGQYLEAAELYQALDEFEQAAHFYKLGGDRVREADMYLKLGDRARTLKIWRELNHWEREVEEHLRVGEKIEAARLLEEKQRWERAAVLFEEANELHEALRVYERLEKWEKVGVLGEQVQAYERAAVAWERLEDKPRAAEMYVNAAKQVQEQQPLDEEAAARLYEKAAAIYDDLLEDDHTRACQRMVRRHRRLPELQVSVQAEKVFVEGENNPMRLEVTNCGFGRARDIRVILEGEFDIAGVLHLRGVAPGRTGTIVCGARAHSGHYGDVPLNIRITYQDDAGHVSRLEQLHFIPVKQARGGLLDELTNSQTPLHVTIGEYYQSGARRVQGDYMDGQARKSAGDMLDGQARKSGGDMLEGQAQKGDRVEMNRGTRSDDPITASEMAGAVTYRKGVGPVRRCPICNLPSSDPQQRYCMDCGGPLPPLTNEPPGDEIQQS